MTEACTLQMAINSSRPRTPAMSPQPVCLIIFAFWSLEFDFDFGEKKECPSLVGLVLIDLGRQHGRCHE